MNQPHPLALVGYGAMAIPTGTSSFPGRPSGSKVTLTNWKRVAITPFEIPADGPAQAVHWRDYVVLFDVRKKEMYLYHHRCGIWSAASTFSDDLSKLKQRIRGVFDASGCIETRFAPTFE